MDMHTRLQNHTEFEPGLSVIYGMHGRCRVASIEVRTLGDKPIRFYRLQVHRSSFSRSQKQDPAIWVPVDNALSLGLRTPLDTAQLDTVMKVVSSREYYFNPNEPWAKVHPELEASIRREGAIGLAKVASFLHVLKKKQIVPTNDLLKFQEQVQRLLFREMSDLLGESMKAIEERVMKAFRSKLIPDQ